MRYHILLDIIHHIALILCMILRAENILSVGFGIVSGGNKIISKLLRLFKERRKFDEPVAANAGVRSSARPVFLLEVIKHFFLENFAEIENIVRYSEVSRHRLCVGGAVPRILHAEGCSGYLVALFFQQIGGNGAVHAAGESYHYFPNAHANI